LENEFGLRFFPPGKNPGRTPPESKIIPGRNPKSFSNHISDYHHPQNRIGLDPIFQIFWTAHGGI
jgi:hypothetical protein